MNSSPLNDLAGLITPMVLRERIQALIDAGFRKSELAKAAGKSPAAVTHWLNGDTKEIKADSAAGLQALTGFSSIWISEGRGPKKTNAITAPSGFITSSGGQNQLLANMQQAPAAINGVASLEQSLNGLAACLMQADATTRTAAGALLMALAQQPDHPSVMASLTTLLAPAAFTQREQKRA